MEVDDPVARERRALLRPRNLLVLVAATTIGVAGIFASIADRGWDDPVALARLAAPGIAGAWLMLQVAWQRGVRAEDVVSRLVVAALVVPAAVAGAITLVQLGAYLVPDFRQAIDAAVASGFHHWWSDGLGIGVVMTLGGGFVFGGSVAVGVCLVIVLPVLAIRSPGTVQEGTRIERAAPGSQRLVGALVFCGLGALVLGIVLCVPSGQSIADLPDAAAALARWGWNRVDGPFAVGSALVLLGSLSATAGVVAMLRASRPVRG